MLSVFWKIELPSFSEQAILEPLDILRYEEASFRPPGVDIFIKPTAEFSLNQLKFEYCERSSIFKPGIRTKKTGRCKVSMDKAILGCRQIIIKNNQTKKLRIIKANHPTLFFQHFCFFYSRKTGIEKINEIKLIKYKKEVCNVN